MDVALTRALLRDRWDLCSFEKGPERRGHRLSLPDPGLFFPATKCRGSSVVGPRSGETPPPPRFLLPVLSKGPWLGP